LLKTFKELIVWQEAMKLVELIYMKTKDFPKEEMYGISSQIKRAAISIPANIAEGYKRKSRKEYLQFLSIAAGSIAELETHILIAQRIGFLAKDTTEQLEIQLYSTERLLSALQKSLSTQTFRNRTTTQNIELIPQISGQQTPEPLNPKPSNPLKKEVTI